MRTAHVQRETKETHIEVRLDLDGHGKLDVQTPLPFLSHMLEQLGKHGLFDLMVRARGDVHIDGHHTTEDLGITLGQAFRQALGAHKGIRRYGWALLPMDEARVACTVDLSGRTFFVGELGLPKARIGDFDAELAEVFFEGFARGAQCNLHVVKERGDNLHHIVEIAFKAFAKALEAATRVDPRVTGVPSTKGTLEG
ncbi:MAG: imidazoleglycerol-phosphate dehydratase HisB [Myxococcales bacterium]|nr:imidazoleglycerol-phosphate dehydratase HisB [Myxococcales bacterium]